MVEGDAVGFAFAENQLPGQAGLGAFEDKELEQALVVVEGNAPFVVVVGDGSGGVGPLATAGGG